MSFCRNLFRMLIITLFILAGSAYYTSSLGNLEILYKWRALEFEFPSQSAREKMIRSKEYIPGAAVPIDVDTWQTDNDNRIFMTIPKFKDGIPASLVKVSERKDGEFHLVQPYPDWSWHTQSCDGITSAFRTRIDKCGRLWVIDSGMVDLFKNPRRRKCQPKLVAFSLINNELSGKYQFPNSVLDPGSILVNLEVDVRDEHNHCHDTFVYVADVTGFSILVFDARRNKSWKVQSHTMYPYPPYGIFRTNGVEFDLMDGIIGLSLGPLEDGDRTLYYHSFASVRESWVQTSVLRNESLYSTGFNTGPRAFHFSPEARLSQAAPQAIDRHGIVYFGPVAENAIHCWNHQRTFTSQHIHEVARDNTNLQFVTGLKVVQPEDGEEELWILTTRFHLVMVDRLNRNEVNFRILKGKISDLVRNSPCKDNGQVLFPYRPKEKPHRRPVPGYGKFS